jgi:serine/threonine protein kinase
VSVNGSAGDPMIGRVLDGRFTIRSRLGAGSMGTVYRAKQHAMGRDVAIKILRSDRALDDASRARFLREARANSLLASPHTVTVFDFGQADNGDFFLAMELLEGESVGQRITRMKRLPVEMAIETARQALRSLAEAHAKGIIHRDLKPDNLFYARVQSGGHDEEVVKVLDFGIAKMMHDENAAMNAVETQAGTVFGTPRYMSPEQAQGKPLDARSDLYSLGVILYHMLTGRPPFTDDDAIVVMARHIKTAPKAPSEACPQAHIPPEVESILMRVLSKEASGRPNNAEAMSQELTRALGLSATATSGVRISLSGATIPPPSTSSPVPVGAPFGAAPLSTPQLPGATVVDSLELAVAAGVPSRRKRRAVLAGAVVAAVLLAGVLVGVRAGTMAPATPPSLATTSVPTGAPSPRSAPMPPATGTAAAVVNAGAPATAGSGFPAPGSVNGNGGGNDPAPPSAAPAPPTPTPRASRPSWSPPRPSPRPAVTTPSRPPPASTPAPTATTKGNYGLFE